MKAGITLAVSLKNIVGNAQAIRNYCGGGVKVCAMIKADAYGHGLYKTAECLSCICDYFGVARLCEAETVRKAAPNIPVLICSENASESVLFAVENDFTLTAFSFSELKELVAVTDKIRKPLSVHIKCDSGMNRFGVKSIDELKNMLEIIGISKYIKLTGIYTHFADCGNKEFTEKQFQNFLPFIKTAKSRYPDIIAHCAASSGIFCDKRYHLDMVRAGINLYGQEKQEAADKGIILKSAMEVYSSVLAVKRAKTGETIGYGCTYKVEKGLSYAVIGAGYGDGYKRVFSNRGIVSIGGRDCPVVGNVCMDVFMALLPEDLCVSEGDTVLLMSDNAGEKQSFSYNAKLYDTITYELLTSFTNRVQRVYI